MIKGKLKKVQQLPVFNALEIIELFVQVGFEVDIDNGDLIILKFID
jgi:hypothetical protein